VLTLRATEQEDPRQTFLRGQLVAHVVLASAVTGVLLWVLGAVTLPLAAAAVLGLLLTTALGHLRAYCIAHPARPRPTLDDSTGTDLISAIDSGSVALFAASCPMLVYPIVFGSLALWLQSSAISSAHRCVVVLLALTLPSALSAWNHMLGMSRELGAVGMLSVSVGRVPLSDEAALRLRRLTSALERVCVSTEPILVDSGALLCGLTAFVVQLSRPDSPGLNLSTLSLLAIVMWVLLPWLLTTTAAFKQSVRSTRTQINEVERQLRGMRCEGARIQVPDDFVPSYRSCMELLARDSAQGRLTFAVFALAAPAFCAIIGGSSENTPGSAALALASYAAIAAAAGLCAMHLGHAASVASSLACRGSAQVRLSASHLAASSDPLRLIEFVGHSLGVSVPLLIKAVAFVTLALAALLK
jgi:hypothetical protein